MIRSVAGGGCGHMCMICNVAGGGCGHMCMICNVAGGGCGHMFKQRELQIYCMPV